METDPYDWSQQVYAELPAYEPAGAVVRLTAGDLLQHTLFIGATGAGKTTVLNQVLKQLIQVPEPAPSMLVLDGKADETAAKITAWAKGFGRKVAVIDGSGAAYFPLFDRLRTLEDLEPVARQLLSASADMGAQNEYWNEYRNSLLRMALGCVLALHSDTRFESVMGVIRDLLLGRDAAKNSTASARRISELLTKVGPRLSLSEKLGLEQIETELHTWAAMDLRTKGIHQSTLMNALSPLLSAAAVGCFQGEGQDINLARHLAVGGLIVVQINALTHPQLAKFLFRMLKDEWMTALAQRRTTHDSCDPLAFLVIDELPLAATPEDVTALQTVRSRRGAIITTCQSLVGLDLVLGTRLREAMLANFANLFFFRSQDAAVDQLAHNLLGMRLVPTDGPPPQPLGGLLLETPMPSGLLLPVCPPGTLARLGVNEAFVVTASGCFTAPLWLAPLYFQPEKSLPTPKPKRTFRDRLAQLKQPETPWRHILMRRQYALHEKLNHPLEPNEITMLAIHCLKPIQPYEEMLRAAKAFFNEHGQSPRGLSYLPTPWLIGLPHILKRLAIVQGQLLFKFEEFYVNEGFLLFHLEGESPHSFIEPDLWSVCGSRNADIFRVHLQHVLYPSRLRPLKPSHAKLLAQQTPF
jgi:hypothetical protein